MGGSGDASVGLGVNLEGMGRAGIEFERLGWSWND